MRKIYLIFLFLFLFLTDISQINADEQSIILKYKVNKIMPKFISSYVKYVDLICEKVGRFVMYWVFFMMFLLILSFITMLNFLVDIIINFKIQNQNNVQ